MAAHSLKPAGRAQSLCEGHSLDHSGPLKGSSLGFTQGQADLSRDYSVGTLHLHQKLTQSWGQHPSCPQALPIFREGTILGGMGDPRRVEFGGPV